VAEQVMVAAEEVTAIGVYVQEINQELRLIIVLVESDIKVAAALEVIQVLEVMAQRLPSIIQIILIPGVQVRVELEVVALHMYTITIIAVTFIVSNGWAAAEA
jgi:hypothetical protein